MSNDMPAVGPQTIVVIYVYKLFLFLKRYTISVKITAI